MCGFWSAKYAYNFEKFTWSSYISQMSKTNYASDMTWDSRVTSYAYKFLFGPCFIVSLVGSDQSSANGIWNILYVSVFMWPSMRHSMPISMPNSMIDNMKRANVSVNEDRHKLEYQPSDPKNLWITTFISW